MTGAILSFHRRMEQFYDQSHKTPGKFHSVLGATPALSLHKNGPGEDFNRFFCVDIIPQWSSVL